MMMAALCNVLPLSCTLSASWYQFFDAHFRTPKCCWSTLVCDFFHFVAFPSVTVCETVNPLKLILRPSFLPLFSFPSSVSTASPVLPATSPHPSRRPVPNVPPRVPDRPAVPGGKPSLYQNGAGLS